MHRITLSIGLIIGAVVLAACGSAGGSGGTLTGVTWALTNYAVDGVLTPVPAGVVADATFGDDGNVAGSGGCNLFFGTYTQDGAKLTIGEIGSTQMFCEGAGSEVETAYLANLAEVASFTATAEQLTMSDGSGATILGFAASEPVDLSGTEWHATGINNGNQGVEGVVDGTDPTAVYDAATGTISGNATCNTYNGSVVVDGSAVTIGPLMSTKMACADEAANRQEANFLTALQAATTWEIHGTTLELRDDSGALQVMFESR